jgi:hypothetical protein
MIPMRRFNLFRPTNGQSLVETAVALPFLLMLIFNVINFGHFFFIALNLSAAPRSGVVYSILGFATPPALVLPSGAAVSTLVHNDMTGALASPATSPVRVCSKVACTTPPCTMTSPGTVNQVPPCQNFPTAGTFSALAPDPESPNFVLHRVDVQYSFRPIIPGRPFGIALLPVSICSSSGGTVTCTFRRQVSMRSMD